MESFGERLNTFVGWTSSSINPAELSVAGFCYTGTGDIVECHSCKGRLNNWEKGDGAWSEHARFYPSCQFLQRTEPTAICIFHRTLTNRRATFRKWYSEVISADQLAEAGFVYGGHGDEVVCHQCLVTVSRWRVRDNAWKKHYAESPGCPFLLQNHRLFETEMATSEVHRYSSFTHFPNKNLVRQVSSLVQLGFYYTGVDGHIRCAFCKLDLDVREGGCKDPMNTHITQSLTCRGNDVLFDRKSTPPSAESIGDEPEMASRLATFWNWPWTSRMNVSLLASAGFVYTGEADRVQCFSCGGAAHRWDEDDHPWGEHLRHFPFCTHVLQRAPLSVLGAKMANVSERQASFRRWPTSSPIAWRSLAEAGFFYLSQSDAVRCFSCGVRLSRWEDGDEAWSEHRRHSPLCTFIGRQPPRPTVTNYLQKIGSHGLDTLTNMGFSVQKVDEALRSLSLSSTPVTFDNVLACLVGPPSSSKSSSSKSSASHNDPTAYQTTVDSVQETVEGASSDIKPAATDVERHLCKVCWDAEIGMLFQPCGHLACCFKCAPRLEQCPICQTKVSGKIRAFLS